MLSIFLTQVDSNLIREFLQYFLFSHSIVILPEYCYSVAMQYRNIARILRHIAAIL